MEAKKRMQESKKLSLSSYLMVGSLLFGLFFGAGNLIFPVHMGQLAGTNVGAATIGFLITATGLPFLGVVALAMTNSSSLFQLASRVHPIYAYLMTIALYLTIGPFFATPRLGTTSFEVGFAQHIPERFQTVGLAVFTITFFSVALLLSLKPTKILVYVGKVLNPLFLLFLGLLILFAFFKPMGSVANEMPDPSYVSGAFNNGFLEGYNTMDALASLAFGVIVVQTIKGLGVTKPADIAKDTIKAGFISVVLMAIIYACLAYIGTMSTGTFAVSENGGIALAQIAHHYFGGFGSFLLAIIATLACLKTAIGLITAGAETFYQLFPHSFSYRTYVVLFSAVSCLAANVGLTNIIAYSLPVLMFLYPLAIVLILMAILSPLFKNRQIVYVTTTMFTLLVSAADFLHYLPSFISEQDWAQKVLAFYSRYVPLFDIGMGWLIPSLIGFILGWLLSLLVKKKTS